MTNSCIVPSLQPLVVESTSICILLSCKSKLEIYYLILRFKMSNLHQWFRSEERFFFCALLAAVKSWKYINMSWLKVTKKLVALMQTNLFLEILIFNHLIWPKGSKVMKNSYFVPSWQLLAVGSTSICLLFSCKINF